MWEGIAAHMRDYQSQDETVSALGSHAIKLIVHSSTGRGGRGMLLGRLGELEQPPSYQGQHACIVARITVTTTYLQAAAAVGMDPG